MANVVIKNSGVRRPTRANPPANAPPPASTALSWNRDWRRQLHRMFVWLWRLRTVHGSVRLPCLQWFRHRERLSAELIRFRHRAASLTFRHKANGSVSTSQIFPSVRSTLRFHSRTRSRIRPCRKGDVRAPRERSHAVLIVHAPESTRMTNGTRTWTAQRGAAVMPYQSAGPDKMRRLA